MATVEIIIPQANHVFTKLYYGKKNQMASSPGQVLNHQEVHKESSGLT